MRGLQTPAHSSLVARGLPCFSQAVDSVVAQHAVAKVTGTVDGFMLVTGVLAPQDHSMLVLANCALHILPIDGPMVLSSSRVFTALVHRNSQISMMSGLRWVDLGLGALPWHSSVMCNVRRLFGCPNVSFGTRQQLR